MSLIIAYSHCIAHGYDMAQGANQQKRAVETGPGRCIASIHGVPTAPRPFKLDSTVPRGKLTDYTRNETRYRMVEQQDPERFRMLMEEAQRDVRTRWALYEQLSRAMAPTGVLAGGAGPAAVAAVAAVAANHDKAGH